MTEAQRRAWNRQHKLNAQAAQLALAHLRGQCENTMIACASDDDAKQLLKLIKRWVDWFDGTPLAHPATQQPTEDHNV